MNNIFFFQTKQIPDTSSIFDQLKEQKIFFSYFQVDRNYYLFLYAQQSIDINLLYQSVQVIEELDSKQRKIRSLRGFFLYVLEIMENGEEYEILNTNLQPFFWRKVKNIIRQNKKAAFQEFLCGYDSSIKEDGKSVGEGSNPRIKILEDQIENLQNQVNFLQQKITQLEQQAIAPSERSEQNQTLQIKKALSELLKASKASERSEQGDENNSSYLAENDSQVRDSTSWGKDMESKSFS